MWHALDFNAWTTRCRIVTCGYLIISIFVTKNGKFWQEYVGVVTNWNTQKAVNIIMVISLKTSRHTVILVLNICFCLSLLIYPLQWEHFKCNSAAAADKTGIISSRSLNTTIDSQKCSILWKWQLKVYCLKCKLYLY